jgi:putative inorganic carbon (HCO3(-)) transporter
MYKKSLILIGVYLAFAPYLHLPDLTLYDSKRILQLVLFGLVGLLVLSTIIKERVGGIKSGTDTYINVHQNIQLLFFLLSVLGIISVLLSDSVKYAFLEYIFFFLLLSLILLLIPGGKKEHYFLGKVILTLTVTYSGIYVIIFLGNYISSFVDPMIILWPDKYQFTIVMDDIEFRGKEVLYFVHQRFFNHTQTWTLPILLGVLCYLQNKKKDKIFSYLLLILISFWWMLVLASGGRGTLISILITLCILLIIWRKDVFHLFKNTVFTLASGGLLYYLLYIVIPEATAKAPILRSTDSGRFSMWEKAIELWLQNPIFGAGPLHYAKIIDAPYASHPHNFYVQFLSEWGFIAFCILIILLYLLIVNVRTNYTSSIRNKQNQVIYISITWSFLAALVHSFFSGVIHTPMSQIWLVLIVSWLLGFNRTNQAANSILYKYRKEIFILLTIIVLILTYSDAISLIDHYSEYMNKYPNERFYPRFWNEGLIPK